MSEQTTRPPSLYDYLGGQEPLERLLRTFYEKVVRDPLLEPVFRNMHPSHPSRIAAFLGEVFGGPRLYSHERGEQAHHHMMSRHLGRHISEEQRKRWMELLLLAADEVGLPSDPEFRSALVAYLEWGSRLARENSENDSLSPVVGPMPRWGWGETHGPYKK